MKLINIWILKNTRARTHTHTYIYIYIYTEREITKVVKTENQAEIYMLSQKVYIISYRVYIFV